MTPPLSSHDAVRGTGGEASFFRRCRSPSPVTLPLSSGDVALRHPLTKRHFRPVGRKKRLHSSAARFASLPRRPGASIASSSGARSRPQSSHSGVRPSNTRSAGAGWSGLPQPPQREPGGSAARPRVRGTRGARIPGVTARSLVRLGALERLQPPGAHQRSHRLAVAGDDHQIAVLGLAQGVGQTVLGVGCGEGAAHFRARMLARLSKSGMLANFSQAENPGRLAGAIRACSNVGQHCHQATPEGPWLLIFSAGRPPLCGGVLEAGQQVEPPRDRRPQGSG